MVLLRVGDIVGLLVPELISIAPWLSQNSLRNHIPPVQFFDKTLALLVNEDRPIEAGIGQEGDFSRLRVRHRIGLDGRHVGDCCANGLGHDNAVPR